MSYKLYKVQNANVSCWQTQMPSYDRTQVNSSYQMLVSNGPTLILSCDQNIDQDISEMQKRKLKQV